MAGEVFGNATLIDGEGFSEIAMPPAPQPAATVPAQAEPAPQPVAPVVLPTPSALPSTELSATLPDWLNQIPETSFTPATPVPEDGMPPEIQLSPEKAAAIQAATTQEEALRIAQEGIREANKLWHDRHSQRLGQEATTKKELERERDMYKAIAIGQRASEMPVQSQSAAPMSQRPAPQSAADLTPLANAVSAARTAMLQADAETYPSLLEKYEGALSDYTEAKAVSQAKAIFQDVQTQAQQTAAVAQANAQADRVRQQLLDSWKGDLIEPIPFKEAEELFNRLVQSDPTLVQRIPPGSPMDRAQWITATVKRAFPRLTAQRTVEALQRTQVDLQTKRAAALITPGVTSPLKGAGVQTPATQTGAYLDYLKKNRDGG